MFADIPNHKLRQAQEKVHRMRESPVFHLLHSLLRLRPEKGFYPALDIERLYRILTTEQSLVMANPGLGGGEQEASSGPGRAGGREQEGDHYQLHMRRQREKAAEERRARMEETEEAKPAIDLSAEMKKFDEPRLKLLLDFFTDHFLRMAERSAKHKNLGQSFMYVRTAENLITLVEEMNYQCVEFREQVIHS